jgi:mannose-6-phosphate isomerase class I
MPENTNHWRKTTQYLMPSARAETTGKGYEIYPAHNIGSGKIAIGYDALAESLRGNPVIIVDGFPGILWDMFHENFSDVLQKTGIRSNFVDVRQAMLSPEKIDRLIAPFTGGDDPLFGFRYPGVLGDFFDAEMLQSLQPDPRYQVNILYGCGAALANWQGPLVYLDVPKNEIQFRARALSIRNLGAAEALPPDIAYKRSYFIDWVAASRHKASLLSKIDWMVDEQRPDSPALVSGADLRQGLQQLSGSCFRVRPWFEPGPWGGQWIREKVPDLAPDVPNYAWSFELIAPENGLILESDGNLLEVSFDMLMFQEYRAVLGESAEKFKYEFPIRYDFLDTVDGGNLSIQVHPRPEYIREHFGETFTQDECYYILDCAPGARVNLGFQQGIAAQDFKQALERSAQQVTPVDMEKYVQSLPVQKHDLFLIPNGTIHGSGAGTMVLEISATPYIFTFKMYDWLRLGLDGKPRTLNIERAFANLYFDRQGKRMQQEFVSKPVVIFEEAANGKYRRAVHLPTHAEHFYDVHRLEFNDFMDIKTENSCHVLSLVEGKSVIVETVNGGGGEFHYAETFIVPAAAESYRLVSPAGDNVMVVKTFVKPVSQWVPGVMAE